MLPMIAGPVLIAAPISIDGHPRARFAWFRAVRARCASIAHATARSRMIRVGTERAEDGEDGVAQEIDHEASVPRDDAHEQVEVIVEDGDHVLGRKSLREGGEAAQVAEERRDLTILADSIASWPLAATSRTISSGA